MLKMLVQIYSDVINNSNNTVTSNVINNNVNQSVNQSVNVIEDNTNTQVIEEQTIEDIRENYAYLKENNNDKEKDDFDISMQSSFLNIIKKVKLKYQLIKLQVHI